MKPTNPAQAKMAKGVSRLIWAVLASCSLIGCAINHNNLAESAARTLRPGMDDDEVRRIFGRPGKLRSIGSNGTVAYYYAWTKDPRYAAPASGYTGPTFVEILSIRFDSAGNLREHMSSSGGIIGNMMVRGGDMAGEIVQALDMDQIIPGRTTLAELVTRFGKPTGRSVETSGNSIYHWIFVDTNRLQEPDSKELAVMVTDGKVVEAATLDVELPIPVSMSAKGPIQTVRPYNAPVEDLPTINFLPFFR